MTAHLRTIALCDKSAAEQFAPWQDHCPPEDLYADMRRHSSPKIEREAARQWAEIPDHPDDIAVWMRGEPVEPQP